jgi:protein phosphatase
MTVDGSLVSGFLAPFLDVIEKGNIDSYTNLGIPLVFPVIPAEDLIAICRAGGDYFKGEPICLELSPPIHIVGDLHGHLLDLIRILHHQGLPPAVHYLFLGDIVDRGQFSLETVTLVFLLKLTWPRHVHIIRGNHEFESVCSSGGFHGEITRVYSDVQVFRAFVRAFSQLPLAARISSSIFCVHGGLHPDFQRVEQIRCIRRPLPIFYDKVSEALLWSDPMLDYPGFSPSERGMGLRFGEDVFSTFLQTNKLQYFVRGHQCVKTGVERSFHDRLITVFSASNYCGHSQNQAGILIVLPGLRLKEVRYVPLPYISRPKRLERRTGSFDPLPSLDSGLFNPETTASQRQLAAPELVRQAKKVGFPFGVPHLRSSMDRRHWVNQPPS